MSKEINQDLFEWDDGKEVINDLTLSIGKEEYTVDKELENIKYFLEMGDRVYIDLMADGVDVGILEMELFNERLEIVWISVTERYQNKGYLTKTIEILKRLGRDITGDAIDNEASVIWGKIKGVEFLDTWSFIIPQEK